MLATATSGWMAQTDQTLGMCKYVCDLYDTSSVSCHLVNILNGSWEKDSYQRWHMLAHFSWDGWSTHFG